MDSQSKKTIFQTILLVVFGFSILLAVGLFSINKNNNKETTTLSGSIEIWGTFPYDTMRRMFDGMESFNQGLRITYVQKKPENFEIDLAEALASGEGPDIFMITPDSIVKHKSKLLTIPYTALSDTVYKNTYTDQAQLFMFSDGIAAFPMFINPLVMYINRDLMTKSYILNPPKTWNELVEMNKDLTQVTDSGEIVQSMIGMGTFGNISHAAEIIATLLFQSGNSITTITPGSGEIGTSYQGDAGVFDFYTGFASKDSSFYSWNNSQRNDRDTFIAGNTVFYIGFADELSVIRAKNPNLNFDIVMIPGPTPGSTGKQLTYGQMTGWGISKVSKNQTLAIGVIQLMSAPEFINGVLSGTWLAPARRDMLSVFPVNDSVRTLIYKSAIISRSYWNPDVRLTNKILESNIDQVNSGAQPAVAAYSNWIADMSNLLQQKQKK